MEHIFFAITPRSTQTLSDSTCLGLIYDSNRRVESFTLRETIKLCANNKLQDLESFNDGQTIDSSN